MKLPNAEIAIIPREKLERYLLSPSHPVGQYKETFFRLLGYTQFDWEVLESDLRDLLGGEANVVGETEFGSKFEIRGRILGPNGRSADLITGWIILWGKELPRFVTAHPEE